MKFLHTSDWHLGQKFLHNDRSVEHRQALEWLLETIQSEQVDALIVAGDIFDIGNPPNYARRLYYQFLTSLLQTDCQHIIIIGGNHDSPSMLDAPKELLRALNVHVVGAASDDPVDEIIELKNEQEELLAVVAAVPFLRDRDLRSSVAGESGMERVARIQAGIRQHYETLGKRVEAYAQKGVPILATGHLYAKGAQASAKQDNIYIGNIENIEASSFPTVFDYVALGHIHRAQAVEGEERIRYCGSLIPLSFSETKDEKIVNIVEFSGKSPSISAIAVPQFRRLKIVKGSLTEVQERLQRLHDKYENTLPVWVEVLVETEQPIPNVDRMLHEFVADLNLELLKIRTTYQHQTLNNLEPTIDLSELDPIEVFKQRCAIEDETDEQSQELLATFRELQDWMRERGNG